MYTGANLMIEFGLSIEGDGFEPFVEAIKQLEEIGRTISGVKLTSAIRKEGRVSNGEVARYQIDQGRDIVNLSPLEAERVAKVFADEVQRRLEAALAKERKASSTGISTAAFREAIKEYMRISAQKIKSQDNFAPLTPEYAKQKQNRFGFTTPILEATGQLIEALNPSSSAGFIEFEK